MASIGRSPASSRFPGGLLAHFDCGFAAPDRQRLEIVGGGRQPRARRAVPDRARRPAASIDLWRGRRDDAARVPTVDQYRLEVDDLTRGDPRWAEPRVDLAFSRGTIATLVDLDRAAAHRA